jgi:voltage-gated potassium channel Kch
MSLRKRINVTTSFPIRIVVSYRRFGRNYQSLLQKSNSLKRTVLVYLTFEDETEKFFLERLNIGGQVVPKRRHESAITR